MNDANASALSPTCDRKPYLSKAARFPHDNAGLRLARQNVNKGIDLPRTHPPLRSGGKSLCLNSRDLPSPPLIYIPLGHTIKN